MKLRYTPEALADLRELKGYISRNLQNPEAAARITRGILDDCAQLKHFPELGPSLDARTEQETGLRYLVCRGRIAFYRIDGDTISVARILDGRQDYMHVLFGEDI